MPINLKNDYFKHSTRSLLTEEQKMDMIEASLKALDGLEKTDSYRETLSISANGRTIKHITTRMAQNLSKRITLIKGQSQCRHLYRRRRRNEVWLEASRISRETGAPLDEVYEAFLQLMDKFVSKSP
jgi:hypothetical protein